MDKNVKEMWSIESRYVAGGSKCQVYKRGDKLPGDNHVSLFLICKTNTGILDLYASHCKKK